MNQNSKIECYQKIYGHLKNVEGVMQLGYPKEKENLDFYCQVGAAQMNYSLNVSYDLLCMRANVVIENSDKDRRVALMDLILRDHPGMLATEYDNQVTLMVNVPCGGIGDEAAKTLLFDKASEFVLFLRDELPKKLAEIFQVDDNETPDVAKEAVDEEVVTESEDAVDAVENAIEGEPVVAETEPEEMPVEVSEYVTANVYDDAYNAQDVKAKEIEKVSSDEVLVTEVNSEETLTVNSGMYTPEGKETEIEDVASLQENFESAVETAEDDSEPMSVGKEDATDEIMDMRMKLNSGENTSLNAFMDDISETFHFKKEQMDYRDKVLLAKAESLKKEKAELTNAKAALQVEKDQLECQKSEMDSERKRLAQEKAQLEQTSKSLSERIQEVAIREKEQRKKEQSVNDRHRNLEKKMRQLKTKELENTGRLNEINEKLERLESLKENFGEMEANISAREKQIEIEKAQLEMKRQTIEMKMEDLKTMEELLSHMESAKAVTVAAEVVENAEVRPVKSEADSEAATETSDTAAALGMEKLFDGAWEGKSERADGTDRNIKLEKQVKQIEYYKNLVIEERQAHERYKTKRRHILRIGCLKFGEGTTAIDKSLRI